MSDNLKRYCAIQKALKSLRPTEPKGNVARHLNTLAMLISAIIGSQKCHLPAIARKVPTGSKPQSRIRRRERFLANDAIDTTLYYLPYVQALLHSLPSGPLVLVLDGSEIGRNCVLLSINVVYKKRALPLCWLVAKARKGICRRRPTSHWYRKWLPYFPQNAPLSSWAMASSMEWSCFLPCKTWAGIMFAARPKTCC